MNISYITKFETLDITNWSGTEYFIAKSLEDQGANLDVICGLREKINLSLRIKSKIYGKPPHQLYVLLKSPEFAKNYAKQISKKINPNVDIVFASASNDSLAYLKTKKPKVFYNDTTFPLMYGYYNWYENICKKTFKEAIKVEQLALNNTQLIIYSSDWAAQSAINNYNINPDKIKVVPFGANISNVLSTSNVNRLINTKENMSSCQILFIGVEWHRKGGDIVLEAVRYLNEVLNLPTVLHLVGIDNITVSELPSYVINHGLISKKTKEGMLEIEKLISESHFLFVPSRAEAFGIVFCEAMAFGVPCISTNTGGIPTIIRNRENGFLQDKDSSPKEYANTIYEAFTNKNLYRQVSLAAYEDYRDRLNWDAAGKKVMQYLKELV